MTARDDVSDRLDELAALIEAPDTEYRPDLLDAMAGLRVAIEASRPRVVATAAELNAIPPGSFGYAGHHPRLLVRRLIGDGGWLIGHEHALQVTSEELIARSGDVTVVYSPPPAETQGDQR